MPVESLPSSTFPQAPLRSRTVGFPESGSDLGVLFGRLPAMSEAQVLTHLHPSTCRFTLKGVPLFTVPPPLRNGGTVGWSALLGDFVVAALKELNEAES